VNDSIIIYWSCVEDEWMRAKEPVPMLKNTISKDSIQKINLNKCPSFHNYMDNIYGVQSLYDYSFYIENGNVLTSEYDQVFFNKHVVARSLEDKSFSFAQRYMFIAEESLEMSAGITPFFEENEVSKRCMLVPGSFDIGRWPRIVDFAFFLRKEYDRFVIKEGDIYQYIKFHTDKKIIFKQFYPSAYAEKHIKSIDKAKENRNSKFKELTSFYDMFRNHKNFIVDIKNSLIE